MALTLGLTGMDPATEASLKVAFAAANSQLLNAWSLLPGDAAEHVIVDMDSMYGPMSWLRLHAAGKTVIGLTSAPRTQADFRLAQPFDTGSVQRLLTELAPGIAPVSEPPVISESVPSGFSAAPQPQDQLPEEHPVHADEEASPPTGLDAVPVPTEEPLDPVEPASAASGVIVPAAPTLTPHVPPSVPPPAPAEPRTLTEWLASGRINGRVGFQREGVTLLLDLDRREYFGPATLRPLVPHVTSEAVAADFTEVADWSRQAAASGAPQPLSRLLWFDGLLAGSGQLLPGIDPQARFVMLKWPQTEREYPRHFRIATVMMKGAATLGEIAEASGVPLADVTDFVNANLATGFAEVERLPEPEPELRKPTGLFGRFRSR
ncbi:hypothetical protein INQ41_04870 [Lysobacter ciconiae]|uniref:Uncharacterized protein n=1 Tax=Novilysobacter ciconiae TaxID=2781022 RepID=A0A7S6ZT60_9GAMM|nr:hypothetical protein [Lysobacter ciconiae]QOW20359.1 hypothetical protein INQ41_04870 [Lysobacter ciconiae]